MLKVDKDVWFYDEEDICFFKGLIFKKFILLKGRK